MVQFEAFTASNSGKLVNWKCGLKLRYIALHWDPNHIGSAEAHRWHRLRPRWIAQGQNWWQPQNSVGKLGMFTGLWVIVVH